MYLTWLLVLFLNPLVVFPEIKYHVLKVEGDGGIQFDRVSPFPSKLRSFCRVWVK